MTTRRAVALAAILALGISAGCAPVPLLVGLIAAGGILGGSGGGHGHGGGGGEVYPGPAPQPAPTPLEVPHPPTPSPSPIGLGPTPEPVAFVPTTLTIITQPSDATTVGVISPTIQISLHDADGHVPPRGSGYSVTIALGNHPGTATLHGTTTVDVGADGSPVGVATFGDLSVDAAGTGYTLVASLVGGSVPGVTTTSFDVTLALPAWLAGAAIDAAETATLGSDGRIYYTNADGNLEAVAPDTSVVTTTIAPPPSGGRTFARLVADGSGLVYLMGGLDSSHLPVSTVEVLDSSSGAWQTLASMPTARSVFGAALGSDGRIYALGGADTDPTIPLPAAEAFDPATGTWATLAPMPSARRWLAAAATVDGNVYTIGGFDTGGGASSTVEVYSIASQTWSAAPSLAQRRIGLAAATGQDGSIYAIGGDSTAGDWGILGTVERLAPGASSWVGLPNMLHARAALGAVCLPDGRVTAVGGFDPFDDDVDSIEHFGPAVALSPSTGAGGDTVVVSGSNFGPSANVLVYWGSPATGTLLGSSTTDALGNLASLSITVPSVPAGVYPVTVTDSVSLFAVTPSFTVH